MAAEDHLQAPGGGLAALATSVAKELAGESPSRLDGSNAKPPSRVLRVEVNGSLHDWFDIEEMGDFVRQPAFADTLLENIARYFHVPVENQAIYDEDGLLTTSADFSRALQRVAPMLYIYDVNEMGPELKERTVEELATINAGVEQTWKNFRMMGSRLGVVTETSQQEVEKLQSTSVVSGDAILAPDDALLSAKPMSPLGPRLLSSSSSTQPAPNAPAKFGNVEPEVVNADGLTEAPPVQVYSLLAPATTPPDSSSKAAASTPALRLAAATDVGAYASLPNTGRTVFSAAQRNEELFTARSAKTSTSSPLGPQVRKTLSPAFSSQVQPQQQVRTASDASLSQPVSRSPAHTAPTRSTTAPATAPILLGNAQSVRWQSTGLLTSMTPSATAPVVPHGGYVLQGSRDDPQLARMVSGAAALERPLSPNRPVTSAARSLTPPPQSTQAYSLEARSITPTPQAPQTLGLDGRLLSVRPPVSPAQVAARNTGLVRMASSTQMPYTSLRGMDRSLSPARARTPPPISTRSVTPTTAAQQRGAEVHAQILRQARTSTGPLRATMPTAVCAANRSSTPVRSLTHPSSVGGSHFPTQSVNQQGLAAWSTLQQGHGASLSSNS